MVGGAYLLDTNVVSDGSKISPSPNVKAKLDAHFDACKISAVSWYELQKGVKRMREGKKRDYLEKYVEEQVLQLYEVLPYDKACADVQSAIFSTLAENGLLAPYQDAQIAATALANGLILVTRNGKDFLPIQKFSHWNLKIGSSKKRV